MKGFLIALQFLTRINLIKSFEIDEGILGRSAYYFPFVGLLIGGLLCLLTFAVQSLVNPVTLAVLIIVAEILITGGLHLDGFMDSCDGLLSGRSRDRILDIMKDSRVGAMGVICLIVLILLKLVFLLEIPQSDLLVVLLIMPLVGRSFMVGVIYSFSYARSEGMGVFFQNAISKPGIIALSLFCLILCLILLPVRLLWALPLTGVCVFLFSRKINASLGGHTGDTYGLMNELAEIIFLFFCVILSKL